MKIKYLGHAGFLIHGTRKIVIDPFLKGNPKAKISPEDVEADIVCVTHWHQDHLGDAVEICRNTGAILVGIHEVAQESGVEAEGMNIGGTIEVKGVKITMVQAFHSAEKGDAAGFILQMDGKTVYHTGDTGLFSDMKLLGEIYKPDVAIIPIGSRYTMDVNLAAIAAEYIGAKKIIPMHYSTFPIIEQDPGEFKKKVEERINVEVIILDISEEVEV